MNIKQFIIIVVLLVLVSAIYIYDTTSAISSRSKCSDYAMNLVVQSFPDSFEVTGETFPPKKLKAESSQLAESSYNLFYNFCVNKRGTLGN